jgi:hypothetical protein
MRRMLWWAWVIVTFLEGIDYGWSGTQNVYYETLLSIYPTGTQVIGEPDSGPHSEKRTSEDQS